MNMLMRLISKEGRDAKMNADFEELYKRFFHDVYLFILAASGDPYIAEEITQENVFSEL